jgi:hypothetical protein
VSSQGRDLRTVAAKLTGAAAAILAAAMASAPPADADGPALPYRTVLLQGLDKITARVSELRVPVDGESSFGTLRITVRACLKTPPTEPPESAAFLEIRVADRAGEPKLAFSGWMFASSPSLSALEHPVYDVWVIDCADPVEAPPEEPVSPIPSMPPPSGQSAPQNG